MIQSNNLCLLRIILLPWPAIPTFVQRGEILFVLRQTKRTIISSQFYLRFQFLWIKEFHRILFLIYRRKGHQISTLFWFNTGNFRWANPLDFKFWLESIITNYLINTAISTEFFVCAAAVRIHTAYQNCPRNYYAIRKQQFHTRCWNHPSCLPVLTKPSCIHLWSCTVTDHHWVLHCEHRYCILVWRVPCIGGTVVDMGSLFNALRHYNELFVVLFVGGLIDTMKREKRVGITIESGY